MSGTLLNSDNVIKDAITKLTFAPHSNNLLVSSWDSSLRLFDVETKKLKLQARTEEALLDCCFGQDDTVAYSVGSSGSIGWYDLQSGAIGTIGKHVDLATNTEYSNETREVISTSWDGKILAWDSRTNKDVRCLSDHTPGVESISLDGFELLVATGSTVHKFDLRKLGPFHGEDYSVGLPLTCVRSMPCTEGFAVGSIDGRVQLHSNSDEMGYTFRCNPKSKQGKYHLVAVNDIILNPVIKGVIVTGDNEGYVIAWDAKSKRRLVELPRHSNSIASLSYNHCGELLAIASSNTYQEANEKEDHPQIFIQDLSEGYLKSASSGSSSIRRRPK